MRVTKVLPVAHLYSRLKVGQGKTGALALDSIQHNKCLAKVCFSAPAPKSLIRKVRKCYRLDRSAKEVLTQKISDNRHFSRKNVNEISASEATKRRINILVVLKPDTFQTHTKTASRGKADMLRVVNTKGVANNDPESVFMKKNA